MTKMLAIGAVLLASISTCVSANAATLDNRDWQAYQITIVENAEQTIIPVEDHSTLEGLCATSCTVRLGDKSEPITVAANSMLVIEDGELYLETKPVAAEDLED